MYTPKPTYWSNPPPPFLPGSRHAPVPGWGANPAVAGPARVGVGAYGATLQATAAPALTAKKVTVAPALLKAIVDASEEGTLPPDEQVDMGMKIPWWYFLTGAVVLGAGAALVYNMGWVGK